MSPQFFTLFRWHVLRYVARHKLLAGLNVLSVALGVAVYLAIQIANRSANESFAAAVDVVAGKSHLEVRGQLDDSLWPKVAAVSGVEAATAIVDGVVTLPDLPGEYLRVIGMDLFTSAPFRTFEVNRTGDRLDFDLWLGQPGSIAISTAFARTHGLKLGSPLRLMANTRIIDGRVVGLIDERELSSDAHIAAIDLGWAQELLGRSGWLNSIQVRAKDPRSAPALAELIRPLLPADAKVEPPRQRSYQMQTMVGAFQLNLTALSLVSLLVGAFLVYNTVFASVTRRKTELGILRALGATRHEIRWLFLGEACVFGVLGVVAGCIGGVLLSQVMIGAVEKTVSSLYLLTRINEVHVDPWQFVVAAGCGMAAVFVGAWVPAEEASRVEAAGILAGGMHVGPAHAHRQSWNTIAVGCLLAATVACAFALQTGPAPLAFVGAFFVLVGFALFSPAVTPWAGRLVQRAAADAIVVRLAADHLVRSVHRNAVTVAALATAVAMTVGLTVMIHSFRESMNAWIERGVVADLFVAPASNEVIGLAATVPDAPVKWLRARPEVIAVDTFRERSVTVRTSTGDRPALLAVVDGAYRNNLQFVGGQEVERMTRVFAGEAVAVTESFARKLRIKAGDTLTLLTPKGAESVPVAGVYADYSRDQGVILMSYPRYVRSWHDSGPNSLAIYLKPEANVDSLAAEFQPAFNRSGEFIVYSNRSLRARIFAIFDQTFAVTYVLRAIALIVAGLGIFLSVTALVAERRRETGMLSAIGAARGQIARMFMTEAGLIGLVSSALGTVAGLALAMVLTWVVNPAFFGWTIHLHLPAAALAYLPAWIIVATIAAAWLPAMQAGQSSMAEAIREE